MMRKFLYILGVVAGVLCSCEKQPEPVPEEPLALKISTDSVYCVPIYKDLPALELAWTSGTNHGTGSAISYVVEMDVAGNNFAGGLKWEIGRTTDRTLVLGHKHLADTLALTFPDLPEDTFVRFEWRARATVMMTDEEQVSEVVSVCIAWNASMRTDLYIIGDAAPNGWNLGQATPMVIDMKDFAVFSWTGNMNKGEFKLLTSNEDWLPCYVSDENDPSKMHLREKEEDYPDFKWVIPYDGNYTIVANTRELTMTITPNTEPEKEEPHLYLIGDATAGGWELSKATLMHIDANDSAHFTWSGSMNKGEFKLLTTIEGWLPCYVCDENDPTKMHLREKEEDYPDIKWIIPFAGDYTIDVNIKELKMTIIPPEQPEKYSHLYMIGDATPGGWSWDDVTEMNHPEKDLFTWSGHLNSGEIKFPTEIKYDWSGEMLYAPTLDCAPSENGTYDAHSGAPDNKWRITEAGDWKIQININDATISFVKL